MIFFISELKAKDPVTLPKLPGLSSNTEREIRTLDPVSNKVWYSSIPDRQWAQLQSPAFGLSATSASRYVSIIP